MTTVKIFAGKGSHALAENIAKSYGTQLGTLTSKKFSDGELSVSYDESIRGCHVFIVQSTYPPAENLMELLLMIDAAKRASAAYVTAIMPYFGYARQDRKDKPRVSIAAKLVANLITSAGADRLMTCDLHAGQIQGFFDIPVDHMDGSAIYVPYLKNLGLDNIVIASPDVGGLGRARRYAKHLELGLAVCDKSRKKANEIESMQLIGEVKDSNVILIDDLIDTGGTLCRAAKMIMDEGARSVRAICTHPILSGDAHEKIENSVLEEVVVTDSIPLKENPASNIKVLSVADLFAKAISKLQNKESISTLFID